MIVINSSYTLNLETFYYIHTQVDKFNTSDIKWIVLF